MPGLIYIICGLTSLGSAWLLGRGALKRHDGLMFWSSLCFFGMGVNNLLLYLNFIIFPEVELLIVARIAMVFSVLVLNFGLIWHTT